MSPSNRAIITTRPSLAEIKPLPYPSFTQTSQSSSAANDPYVIVKATAWSVNPTDWKHVTFEGAWDTTGCVQGYDYAGVVAELGDVAEGEEWGELKVGDRISGTVNGANILIKSQGAFAEYFLAKRNTLMKIPDNITDAQAAGMGIPLLATSLTLYQAFKFPLPIKGHPSASNAVPDTMFVYSGTTASALVGIQFAKLAGVKTLVTTASPANQEYVKSLGADIAFDYKLDEEELVAKIRDVTGGKGVDVVWDCHADDRSGRICVRVLSDNGPFALPASSVEEKGSGLPFMLQWQAIPRHRITTLLPSNIPSILQSAESTLLVAKQITSPAQVATPLGYAVSGDPWVCFGIFPAQRQHYELMKAMYPVLGELMKQEVVKPLRVFENEGGKKGLEGVLHGLEVLKAGKVSAGKLIFTAE